ncbi:alpha/beta fold hydrolase [Kocuria sp. M1N1S27]|uniref:alpha/beta fold hydrolase n=1 Tax=Kocuria kalidii TaxID=3376283 RepID=UPI003799A9B5
MPALVLAGDQDQVIPWRRGEHLARALGHNTCLVVVPGAGHRVDLTHPEIVNTALIDLLDEAQLETSQGATGVIREWNKTCSESVQSLCLRSRRDDRCGGTSARIRAVSSRPGTRRPRWPKELALMSCQGLTMVTSGGVCHYCSLRTQPVVGDSGDPGRTIKRYSGRWLGVPT